MRNDVKVATAIALWCAAVLMTRNEWLAASLILAVLFAGHTFFARRFHV